MRPANNCVKTIKSGNLNLFVPVRHHNRIRELQTKLCLPIAEEKDL